MISTLGDTGLLSRTIGDSAGIRRQLATLTQQASTGRKAETYAGLGPSVRLPLSLRPQIASGEQWQANIGAAAGRLDATQTALSGIAGIAANFFSQSVGLNGLDPAKIDSVASAARSALQQVAGLLNTQVGDTYLFAGQDSANPPVPAAGAILGSSMFTGIRTAVAGLAVNGAAMTVSSTLAAASGPSPFSPGIGGVPVVEVGPGRFVETGVLADRNTLATSGGPSTTGSYMRDVMRALSTLGSLTSAQASAPGFDALMSDTRESLRGSISAMSIERGALGDVQRALGERRTLITDEAASMRQQISSVEDVDLAETLSRLTQTRTRLEASYQIISGLKSLSLTNYL